MSTCPGCNSDRVNTIWTHPGIPNIRVSAYECLDCGSVWSEPVWSDVHWEMNKLRNRIKEEV